MQQEFLIPNDSRLFSKVEAIYLKLDTIFVGTEFGGFTPLELTFRNGLSTSVDLYELDNHNNEREFWIWYPWNSRSFEPHKDILRSFLGIKRWSMGFNSVSYALKIGKERSNQQLFGSIIEDSQNNRLEKPLESESFPSERLLEITQARLIDIPDKIEYREA